MRAGLLAFLLVACATPPPDADGGADAPTVDTHDAGTDTGFTATSIAPCTLAAPPAFTHVAHVVIGTDALEDRDFYVLTAIEADGAAMAALRADATLSSIASARARALRDADVSSCDPACVHAALVRTDDAAAITATLAALDAPTLARLATTLRDSLTCERFVQSAQDDRTLLTTALTEAMANLASAFDGYAVGELAAPMLASIVHTQASTTDTLAWWQPLARVTTAAMIADGRNEAIRYEPLVTGENAAAIAAIATTDFGAFPYVAILVPGQGPNDATTALNPMGAARCDLAVARYRAGLAPFLLVSGGHVHPDRTMFSEAIEMKRYLQTTYDVPESAILVEPYARHTTTNLRNAIRELFAYGAPSDGRVLIVSDLFQSAYIAGDGFATRCDTELFYRPFVALQVLSTTDTCMTMAPASLTIAASDPLDP